LGKTFTMVKGKKMTFVCIECGKKLERDESAIGFCADCNARIENDMRILRETEDDSFAFLPEITT
jgi:DNA-directed RNA polymerase subunit RPC12/RpoP